ncbi:MAG: PAS domain S-box protein [Candidatus Hodarchaeales archaeon]
MNDRRELAELSNIKIIKLFSYLSGLITANLPLDTVFEKNMKAITDLTRASHSIILLLDERAANLLMVQGYNIAPEILAQYNLQQSINYGEDAFGIAAAYKEFVFVPDIDKTPMYNLLNQSIINLHFKSATIIPLVYRGKSLGVLAFFYKNRHELEPLELELLKISAHFIAISLSNTRLFRELKGQKERYQKLFDQANDSIVLFSSPGYIKDANRKFIDISGYTLEQLKKMTFKDIIAGEYQSFKEFYRDYGEEKKNEAIVSLRCKNGEKIPVAVKVTRITNQRSPDMIQILFKDISNELRVAQINKVMKKYAFQAGQIEVAVFKNTLKGPETIIADTLRFSSNSKELLLNLSVFYMTAIGQGEVYAEGLYELPVGGYSERTSLVYAFRIYDKNMDDPRLDNMNYCLLTVIYPRLLEEFFSDRVKIEQTMKELVASLSELEDIDGEFIQRVKKTLLGIENN